MNLFEAIILAMALSVETLIVLRYSAFKTPILLTRGLALSALLAVIQSGMLAVGLLLGDLLRLDDREQTGLFNDVNNLIYLGVMVCVALKLMPFKKKREHQAYDISQTPTAIALSFALGINVLLVGVAIGFRGMPKLGTACIPMGVVAFLSAYLAIMMGRQNKHLRERRWLLIAVLFLLVSAIFYVVEY